MLISVGFQGLVRLRVKTTKQYVLEGARVHSTLTPVLVGTLGARD